MYSLVRRCPNPRPRVPVVAAFDVDGTLTTEDCVVPFLRRAAGWRLASALLRHPMAVGAALVRRDRDRLKELASRRSRDGTRPPSTASGVEFARDFVAHRLRDDTTARLARHRELGHTVILASASFESYLAPLGAALEVDGIVCTRARATTTRAASRGGSLGANCRGPEKARRVLEWVAAGRARRRGALGLRRLARRRRAARRSGPCGRRRRGSDRPRTGVASTTSCRTHCSPCGANWRRSTTSLVAVRVLEWDQLVMMPPRRRGDTRQSPRDRQPARARALRPRRDRRAARTRRTGCRRARSRLGRCLPRRRHDARLGEGTAHPRRAPSRDDEALVRGASRRGRRPARTTTSGPSGRGSTARSS